jgi:hypothetical protein
VYPSIHIGHHHLWDSLCNKSTLDLIGFIDYDWDGDSIDHKSTSGYSLSLGSRPIYWLRKMLEILHTHLGIIFPKVFPMFTSHYSVSYSLGRIFL